MKAKTYVFSRELSRWLVKSRDLSSLGTNFFNWFHAGSKHCSPVNLGSFLMERQKNAPPQPNPRFLRHILPTLGRECDHEQPLGVGEDWEQVIFF